MQNKEIIKQINELQRIDGEINFPVEVSAAILINLATLKNSNKEYEQKLKELTNEYNIEIEKGYLNLESLEAEKKEEFKEKLDKLLNIEQQVDIIKISIGMLKNFNISLNKLNEVFNILDFMIE